MVKLLYFCSVFLPCSVFAQTFHGGYFHANEDYAERVFENADGTFLVVGTGHNNGGNYYGPWRIQISSQGELLF